MESTTTTGLMQRWRRWLLLVLALLLSCWILWPRPAFGWVALTDSPVPKDRGASLFAEHCAGCHVNGGNVIRRSKTLRLAALQRAGLAGPEAIAKVASLGQGQMGGYAGVLGEDGAEAVGTWVWSQAMADWPKSDKS